MLEPWELEKINLIRRGLAGHKPEEAIQRLLMFVKKFPTNRADAKGDLQAAAPKPRDCNHAGRNRHSSAKPSSAIQSPFRHDDEVIRRGSRGTRIRSACRRRIERPRLSSNSIFRWLALIMDNLLRVPGTQFPLRFRSFDRVDSRESATPVRQSSSAMALIAAARADCREFFLARMALNILINEAVGIIPVVGDAFSFWFKSNARNYELLRQHARWFCDAHPAGDWLFVSLVLGAVSVFSDR